MPRVFSIKFVCNCKNKQTKPKHLLQESEFSAAGNITKDPQREPQTWFWGPNQVKSLDGVIPFLWDLTFKLRLLGIQPEEPQENMQ